MEHIKQIPIAAKVTSIIRKAVFSGEFPAGMELSLAEISEKLNVSRTPVRDALQVLSDEGLVILRGNKSAVVAHIDADFIRDHFNMRKLMEGEAAALCALSGADMGELEDIHRKFSAAVESGNRDEYTQWNYVFHEWIWNASGSPKLYRFCQMLWNGPSYTYRNLDCRQRHDAMRKHELASLEEHEAILAKLLAGDADGARYAMHMHMQRSMDNMLVDFPAE